MIQTLTALGFITIAVLVAKLPAPRDFPAFTTFAPDAELRHETWHDGLAGAPRARVHAADPWAQDRYEARLDREWGARDRRIDLSQWEPDGEERHA